MGYIDTDLTADIDSPKHAPEDVVAEVLVDDISRQVKGGLSSELGVLYPSVA